VRSNERGRIGFLRVPNRLNVAISRAKHLVAAIGDSATLRAGEESMYGELVEAARSTGGWLSALELVSQPKPRRGEQRQPGQAGGGEGGEEIDPERAAKRRRRRRRGRRGAQVPVTASTEPGAEGAGATTPAPPAVDGQPQEGAQRRRRRRRRRGRGRGQGLGQPGTPGDEGTSAPPGEQPTVAPAAGDSPEA
jgi:AAA domain